MINEFGISPRSIVRALSDRAIVSSGDDLLSASEFSLGDQRSVDIDPDADDFARLSRDLFPPSLATIFTANLPCVRLSPVFLEIVRNVSPARTIRNASRIFSASAV